MKRDYSPFYQDVINPAMPCYVIAEAGVNHNGCLDTALQLIDCASYAKANAVKFQTFNPEELVVRDAPLAKYQKETLGEGQSQYSMLSNIQLEHAQHFQLQAYCERVKIDFLSTPFEEASGDFLETLKLSAFKIPSGEITNLPFLAHMGAKGKTMILSTGMSNLGEVEAAVETIEKSGNSEIIILHCVSQYPAPVEDINLRAMETLREAFGYPVGFSDHSLGSEASLAAVSLGARIIEKHFTLNKAMIGPDHKASLEPEELIKFIGSIREVEKALGSGRKRRMPCEENTAKVARKSVVAKIDILAGQKLTMDNIVLKRPGDGLSGNQIDLILGRTAKTDISKNTKINLGLLL